MAGGGGLAKEGSYGNKVGLIFVFNLIVGAGSLTLPKVFHSAGIVLSTCLLAFFGFLAYVTVTYILEVQSSCNAMIRTREVLADENQSMLNEHSDENMWAITTKIEMVEMAEMLMGRFGQIMFLFALVLYLYGDLAIYATAVPKSLNQLVNRRLDMFGVVLEGFSVHRFFTSVFGLFTVPFCFFNFSNTKYLQFTTMVFRNLAFGFMIVAAVGFCFDDDEYDINHSQVQLFNFEGVGEVFGKAVYSFMCHHSLPSLISPIKHKNDLPRLFGYAYLLILVLYLLLAWTGEIAFGNSVIATCSSDPNSPPCSLQDLYTLNFSSYHIKFISRFLILFPAFSLTTNYPLICITLRNNLLFLFERTLLADELMAETPRWKRVLTHTHFVSAISAIPPILVALTTEEVGMLVNITGSFGGNLIQFLIPALLVYSSRKYWKNHPIAGVGENLRLERVHGYSESFQDEPLLNINSKSNNPFRSPFGGIWMISLVLAFSSMCMVLSVIYLVN